MSAVKPPAPPVPPPDAPKAKRKPSMMVFDPDMDEAPPVRKAAAKPPVKKRASPNLPGQVDIPAAAHALMARRPGQTAAPKADPIKLSGVPKHLFTSYGRIVAHYFENGVHFHTGAGLAAAAVCGLGNFLNSTEVADFRALLSEAGLSGAISYVNSTEFDDLVARWEWEVPDTVGKGRRQWGFRCPETALVSLHDTELALTDIEGTLKARFSQILPPCVAFGLARQPGLHKEASPVLEAMFRALKTGFAMRTRMLRAAFEELRRTS